MQPTEPNATSSLPYHPRQGERVEWDMNCTTHHGLYVEWLPFPEVMRCNHRVVSEEYGLLTFEDNGTLRPAKATVQSGGDLRDLANAVIADAGKGFSRGGTVPPAWQKPVKLARRVLAMLDDAGQSERPKCEQCGDKGWIDGHGPEEDCKCGLVQAACPDCRPEQYCALCRKEIVNELCHTNMHGHKPVAKPTVQAKCVLCGQKERHDEWCDRNPAKGQSLEYQCARVACAVPVPKGFGQYVDGTDGSRVGTNVATVEEWRQFFVTFLAQGLLAAEQPQGEKKSSMETRS